jgi:hypothetical protein
MKCCGRVRDTAFCPDCGKKLVTGDIGEIHLYFTNQLNEVSRRHALWVSPESSDLEANESDPRRKRIIDGMESRIARLTRWIRALEAERCNDA